MKSLYKTPSMIKRMFFFITVVFLISYVSATITLSPSTINLNVQPGNTVSLPIQVSTDSNLSQTIQISKNSGSYASWFNFDSYIFSIINTNPANRIISINIPTGTSSGIYALNPQFNLEGYTNGPVEIINLNVTSTTQPNPSNCNIDIFPTILTNVKIQQGEIKTRNIQLIVPSCYNSYIKVNGVLLQTDEKPIELGEISLGNIQPGNSVMIPISIDATGTSTGQYSDTLEFQLYNSSGNKVEVSPVSISVIVTSGISPISNFSLSNLPSCSLSAIEMSLNSTYRITCSNINPNIDIHPVIDMGMIEGTNVIPSSSQYIYEFKPKNIGTTIIGLEFWYKFFPIGSGFQQEVRITPSGSEPVSGTTMKFEFIPSLSSAKNGDLITIHAVDNKTNSYVTNAQLFLDGILINGSFVINSERNYSLRAVSNGYLDYIEYVYINPKSINLTMPSSLVEGQSINVLTSPENASLFLDGQKVDNPFYASAGSHELEAIYEGYQSNKINFSVSNSVQLIANSTWEKGIEQIFILNQNSTWQVLYAKDTTSQFNQVSSGNDDKVIFTPDKKGIYKILVNGEDKGTYEILGFDFNKKWWFMPWYLWFLIPIGIVVLIFLLGKSPSKSIGDISSGGFDVR